MVRDVSTARNILEQFADANSKTRGKANHTLQKIQGSLEKRGLISQAVTRSTKTQGGTEAGTV